MSKLPMYLFPVIPSQRKSGALGFPLNFYHRFYAKEKLKSASHIEVKALKE